MWGFQVVLAFIMLAPTAWGQGGNEPPTELPTTNAATTDVGGSSQRGMEDKPVTALLESVNTTVDSTTKQIHLENVATEEGFTVTPTTIPASTKKPAPLVIHSDNLSSNQEVHFPAPLRSDERTIPKAPPPTPSTPAAASDALGIGELLNIPGLHLTSLDKASAVIEAVQKLG